MARWWRNGLAAQTGDVVMSHLTSKQREALYDRCRGDAEYPSCNICLLPITPGQLWHESHNPLLPKALGGLIDGIAHARCNLDHNHQHDTPLVAKVRRRRQKHIGAFRRKQYRPLPGTKASGWRHRMNGDWERR
jgi:hypothetical protein